MNKALIAERFSKAIGTYAQKKKETINDSNTPLHLLQPEYKVPYKALSTTEVKTDIDRILRYLEKKVIRRDNPYTTPVLKEVVADSYQRLIAPAIERELRNELTEKAEDLSLIHI